MLAPKSTLNQGVEGRRLFCGGGASSPFFGEKSRRYSGLWSFAMPAAPSRSRASEGQRPPRSPLLQTSPVCVSQGESSVVVVVQGTTAVYKAGKYLTRIHISCPSLFSPLRGSVLHLLPRARRIHQCERRVWTQSQQIALKAPCL